jgi:hypothetical protein
MLLSIAQLNKNCQNEQYALHEENINPRMMRVQ